MKRIGLIGGMSWESTQLYYRWINEGVAGRLGGLHSADLLLQSVDFAEIEALMREDRWDELGDRLAAVGRNMQRAGADFLVVATNTMHRLADRITGGCTIPLVHIANATGRALADAGHHRVLLLGTRATMTASFFRDILDEQFGIEVLTPPESTHASLDRIIFQELCRGKFTVEAADALRTHIDEAAGRGADAAV
ncbi:MAG: amino acid racemase, partial [Gammaproteobacteria bacterium]